MKKDEHGTQIFKVLSTSTVGNVIELCSDKNVILLYRAKKQPQIASLVRRGDLVTIKDGIVSLYLGDAPTDKKAQSVF